MYKLKALFTLIFILFSSLSTNLIANYIPSQNVLLNLLPKNLSLKSSGLIIVLLGFFVGQAMKKTKGKANPKILNELLLSKLTKKN